MAAHVPSRLYRSRSQKMLAGVCGGLGEYFDVDPVLIRLLFVVTSFISGVGILAYIVLWIVVPFEGGDTSRIDTLKRDFDDVTGRLRDFVDPPRAGTPPPPPWQAGPSGPAGPGGPTGSGGPGRRDEPDVTGYHGSYGPAGSGPSASDPRSATFSGGNPAAASPFDTGRDAAMTSDSASARVPGTDDPTANPGSGPAATADRPAAADASGSATAASSPGSMRVDDSPLEIDPPAGPPAGPPPFGTPPFGAPAGSATGNYAGAAPGTPPFGSPYGPPPGTPPFGSPFAEPAGGPASGSYGARAGGQPWSAPRDSGPAFTTAAPPERKRRRQHWAGAILILVGLMILGNNLGLLFWVKMQYVMPLILVGLGAWLMFGRGRRG